MKRKLSEVTANQVIQTTEENDLKFRELLVKEGYEWRYGLNLLEVPNSACYIFLIPNKKVRFSMSNNEGKEILPASDFLEPKISKKDLLKRIEEQDKRIESLEKNIILAHQATKDMSVNSYGFGMCETDTPIRMSESKPTKPKY